MTKTSTIFIRNSYLIFHTVLTLVFYCAIVSLLSFSDGWSLWIPGCKFPQAGPLALRKLSDFIRQSQCLRHATPNAIASRKVRPSYKSKLKLKLKICTCSHQLSTSSPGMTEKERCSGMTIKNKVPGEDGKKNKVPGDDLHGRRAAG